MGWYDDNCSGGPKINIPHPGNKNYSYTYSYVKQFDSIVWCNKGQELRQYNWFTDTMDIWEAQKDIRDLKDMISEYQIRQEELRCRKLITAQANFDLLNQQ